MVEEEKKRPKGRKSGDDSTSLPPCRIYSNGGDEARREEKVARRDGGRGRRNEGTAMESGAKVEAEVADHDATGGELESTNRQVNIDRAGYCSRCLFVYFNTRDRWA